MSKRGLPYAVAFKTREIPGRVRAITVKLDSQIGGPNDAWRTDLVDHPLYHHLRGYVLANLAVDALARALWVEDGHDAKEWGILDPALPPPLQAFRRAQYATYGHRAKRLLEAMQGVTAP